MCWLKSSFVHKILHTAYKHIEDFKVLRKLIRSAQKNITFRKWTTGKESHCDDNIIWEALRIAKGRTLYVGINTKILLENSDESQNISTHSHFDIRRV